MAIHPETRGFRGKRRVGRLKPAVAKGQQYPPSFRALCCNEKTNLKVDMPLATVFYFSI
ncbi:MAG: hypothetical protein ACKO96_11025 [Flammeovirgaceae bacterium]